MAHLIISKKNEVYLNIEADIEVYYELREKFSFDVENAKYMSHYRNKHWDGRIYLFNINKKEIYIGLLDKVIEFCKARDYTYEFVENKFFGLPYEPNEDITYQGVKEYMSSISNLPARDYQIDGVFQSLQNNRKLILSPTASGKSLVIYALCRYYVERGENILIIVPKTSLVEQMYKDFEDYGFDVGTYCHKLYGGREKEVDSQIVCSTWQSIYKLPQKYFNRFGVVIGDEVHLFKSKSLVSLMTKLHASKYRFGFTGTLDGIETHKWVLEGLFGPSYRLTRTDEMIEMGHAAQLQIKVLLLKHTPTKFQTYEDEIQYLINNQKRNNFIRNLALDLKGNTLILFQRVDTHGKILYDLINNKKSAERKVWFIHGGVETNDREEVRAIIENEDNAIIVASYGTFSTGVNIKNLHNIIFASPSKSRVRNLQSIGRVLRKSSTKKTAVLYDIADDIKKGAKNNYTLNHLISRIKIYNEEKFNYKIVNLELN